MMGKLQPMILIHQIIRSTTILLILRTLRRVPPRRNPTRPLTHRLRRPLNMLLTLLLDNHPVSSLSIYRLGIDIHRPVPHVSLELRAGVAENTGAELLAHAVEFGAVFCRKTRGVGLGLG